MNIFTAVRGALSEGKRALVHRIEPTDLERERRFLQQLAPATKRQRFLGAVGQPSEAQLLRLVSPRPGEELALAWMVEGEFAAVARYALLSSNEEQGFAMDISHQEGDYRTQDGGPRAEFAIVVADPYQGQGIGKKLILALIGAAREAGVATLEGDCYVDNHAVLGLVESLGFTVNPHATDAGLLHVQLSLNASLGLKSTNTLHHASYQ